MAYGLQVFNSSGALVFDALDQPAVNYLSSANISGSSGSVKVNVPEGRSIDYSLSGNMYSNRNPNVSIVGDTIRWDVTGSDASNFVGNLFIWSYAT